MASIKDVKRMCKEHFKCEGCPFIDFGGCAECWNREMKEDD